MPLLLPQTFDEDFCSLMAKLRTKYPAEIFYLEGIHESQLDINEYSRDFFRGSEQKSSATVDNSIDPNANVASHDVITFNYEVSKPKMKLNSLYNLWLEIRNRHKKELADTCIEAEISGAIYINDCWDIGRPYCFNYATLDIALEGLPMAGRLNICPPKGLSSFLHQVEQFTVTAANMTLGATGMADLLLVSSWFVDRIMETGKDHKIRVARQNEFIGNRYGVVEEDVWIYVKELLTHLIYTINYEFRGNQSPFTNISVYDDAFLEQLLPVYLIDGKAPNKGTVQVVQQLFLKVYNEELARNPITFPVVTACFSTRTDENGNRCIADNAFLHMVVMENLNFGFINFYMGETSTLSSCCRLRSSISDLGYANTFGAGSTKIGSLGVVTLNLPRMASLAREAGDAQCDALKRFLQAVAGGVYMVATVNKAKRDFIADRIKRGVLPLYQLGFMDLSRQFSTCGYTGLYEALEILGLDIIADEGLDYAEQVLDTINIANERMTSLYGDPHNMEQVPGESSAVKLAKKDTILGTVPDEYHLYSNQFLPLWAEGVDLLDRIHVQGRLDPACTGGAVCHLNVGTRIADPETMKALMHHACSEGVVYIAVNYMLGQCSEHHVTAAVDKVCPICGKDIEVRYTRVVGFLTDTSHWNKTRREHDLPNRKFIQPQNRGSND